MTATNYAVAPGEYLEEWINEHGLSQQRVAEQLGCSRKQVNEIVNGRAPITSDTAVRLERVVGIPADSWLRYEAAYRADLARIADEENLAAHADEIDPGAVTYLRSLGATKANRRSGRSADGRQLSACCWSAIGQESSAKRNLLRRWQIGSAAAKTRPGHVFGLPQQLRHLVSDLRLNSHLRLPRRLVG